MLDLPALQDAVDCHGVVMRVVVALVSGSTPREAGTDLLVWATGQVGTIGGGQLEYQAAAMARHMLRQKKPLQVERIPLGPSLGQCCGGAVTLVYERMDVARLQSIAADTKDGRWRRRVQTPQSREPAKLSTGDPGRMELIDGWLAEPVAKPPRAIFIYGAGHVARALAPVLSALPGVVVTVFDPRQDEAALMSDDITCITSLTWEQAAASAPANAAHFIMTPEHEVDLALCHQLLARKGFAYAGLIGSATKWTRFRKRLAAFGHAKAEIARIICPIGDPALGKHPQAIAIGVAAALLKDSALSGAQGEDHA